MSLAPETNPSRVIFIRGLQSKVSDEQIREAFSPFGEIRKIFNIMSRGMCFVTYYDIRDATAALSKSGAALHDVTLAVEYATPRPPLRGSSDTGGHNNNSGNDEDPNADTLFVRKRGGDAFDEDNTELIEAFTKYGAGDVQKVRGIQRDGHCKFIQFYDVRCCERALISAEDQVFAGGQLHVELAKSQMGRTRKRKPPPSSSYSSRRSGSGGSSRNGASSSSSIRSGSSRHYSSSSSSSSKSGRSSRRNRSRSKSRGRSSKSSSSSTSSSRRKKRRDRSRSRSREKRRHSRRSRSRSRSRSRGRSHRSSASSSSRRRKSRDSGDQGADALNSLGLTQNLAGHLLQLLQQQQLQQSLVQQHQQPMMHHQVVSPAMQHHHHQAPLAAYHHQMQPPNTTGVQLPSGANDAAPFDPNALEKLKHSLAALKRPN